MAQIIDTVMKCNTCMAAFPSLDAIKDHYRGEWHCLNSKRRAQQLVPLKRDQFVQLVKTAVIQKPAPPAPTSSSKINGKLLTKPDNKALKQSTPAPVAPEATQELPIAVIDAEKNEAEEIESDKKKSNDDDKVVVEDVDEEEEDDDAEWEDVDEDEEEGEEDDEAVVARKRKEVKLGAHISIFNDKDCKTAEDCAKYMAFKFGFFIPDAEYLTDLSGLLEYVGEKVKLGNICLYCQKTFGGARACQNHMISTSHCKLRYEEGVDLEEFEDFYDFSTTYEDVDEVELDENGEVKQEEVSYTTTGEMQLPDGRVVGHRQYRVYYKQHYRPEDTRAPIVAQQKEELLRLGNQLYGHQGGQHSHALQTMNALSEAQVMAMLIKYQTQLRKSQTLEQRGLVRQQAKDQRREYKSNLNKVRSSETTTAKIRDYHGTLK